MQGPLIEGYTNKVPKVVVGALDATLISIRSAAAWAVKAPCMGCTTLQHPRHSTSSSSRYGDQEAA
jgi:hypothetical protein